MINVKNFAVILSFIPLTITVITIAVSQEKAPEDVSKYLDVESSEKTRLEHIHYYLLEEFAEKLFFRAEDLDIEEKEIATFTDPNGRYFVSNRWVRFEADSGHYLEASTELFLNQNVKFFSEESEFSSDTVSINNRKQFVEARGQVKAHYVEKENKEKMDITSNAMNSWLAEERAVFMGNVNGVLTRDRRYEGKMDFFSQLLEYNQSKLLLTLENDVVINRNNYNLRAQKGYIYLENFNKKLKYYTLNDDIKLVERFKASDGTERVRRAFAEKLEGYISEGKIVLLGTPRVEQGTDVIKGYQITLRENVEVVEVDDSQSSFDIKRKK